jgi:hypothetical protein
MYKALQIVTLLILSAGLISGQPSPYKTGEKVTYIVHYGPINGGIASLELKKDTFAGKEVIRSYFLAQTTGVADALYKIKDVYESYMDPVSELPVKSVRNIQEGRYRKYNVVLFDHDSRPDSAILTSDLTGKHITQKGIHDVISCFYYFRKHFLATNYNFKKGEIISIMTWFADELYPIQLVYAGMEDVKTRAGKIKCYKFNPVTEVGRLFKTNEDASFWFSADKNCLPVKIRFDIFVGAFSVDLNTYEGLTDTLEIKTR